MPPEPEHISPQVIGKVSEQAEAVVAAIVRSGQLDPQASLDTMVLAEKQRALGLLAVLSPSSSICEAVAFLSARTGLVGIVLALVECGRVSPFTKNKKGNNLLHAAAAEAAGSNVVIALIKSLPSRSIPSLFFQLSKRGHTPIEVAAKGGQLHLVEELLSMEPMQLIQWDTHPPSVKLHRRIMASKVNRDIKNLFEEKMRSAQVIGLHAKIDGFDGDVDQLKLHLSKLEWWNERQVWSRFEAYLNYNVLRTAVTKGQAEMVAYLLTIWKVPPTPILSWQNKVLNIGSLSLADFAGIGQLRGIEFEADDELVEDSAFANALMVEIKRTEVYEYFKKWDGKLENLKKSRNDGSDSRLLQILAEENVKSRMNILDSLSKHDRSKSSGVPRADLMVVYGSFSIFKKFVESGEYDLTANVLQQTSGDSEGQGEDCPICLEPVENQVLLDCSHLFCEPCLAKVGDAGEKLKCPLCRQESSVVFAISFWVLSSYSWLVVVEQISTAELLVGLAAGTDAVAVLDYLISKFKIDPLKLRFAGGDTILHIAAKQGAFISSKWIISNGYDTLADIKNETGLTPLQCNLLKEYKQSEHVDAALSSLLSYSWLNAAITTLFPGREQGLLSSSLASLANLMKDTKPVWMAEKFFIGLKVHCLQTVPTLIENAVPAHELEGVLSLCLDAATLSSPLATSALQQAVQKLVLYNHVSVLEKIHYTTTMNAVENVLDGMDPLYNDSEPLRAFKAKVFASSELEQEIKRIRLEMDLAAETQPFPACKQLFDNLNDLCTRYVKDFGSPHRLAMPNPKFMMDSILGIAIKHGNLETANEILNLNLPGIDVDPITILASLVTSPNPTKHLPTTISTAIKHAVSKNSDFNVEQTKPDILGHSILQLSVMMVHGSHCPQELSIRKQVLETLCTNKSIIQADASSKTPFKVFACLPYKENPTLALEILQILTAHGIPLVETEEDPDGDDEDQTLDFLDLVTQGHGIAYEDVKTVIEHVVLVNGFDVQRRVWMDPESLDAFRELQRKQREIHVVA
ncbi:UNVERIFIED_CONTAM: hypothetical protein HDU68_001990 [Siphonaria sp. JEL0065]|nr:hypothetical protein HDU68_001990 [Siphonaria sp. JEL0065]